jgi:predicted FMN-binding regulatory protein PaiB
MSQNRWAVDAGGVVRGLAASLRAGDREVAEIVESPRPAAGP